MTELEPIPHVQPIVLLIDKTDPADAVDAIRAVALASVGRYARDLAAGPLPDEWAAWLAGAFTKSVRRADAKSFEKVLLSFPPHAFELVTVGRAAAIAFRPMPADQLPKILSRLQVSGTQLDNAGSAPVAAGSPTVRLDADLGMSTGKAAAQAAHALFLWALQHDDLLAVHRAGLDCAVRFLPRTEFVDLLAVSGATAVITDAGRTEIEPGSVTAFAC